MPTVLQWSAGGNAVFVTGSFNAWEERIPLRRSGTDHVVCLNLPPGKPSAQRGANAVPYDLPLRPCPAGRLHKDCALAGTYQYKFIVDNEWRFATDQPTVRDEMGNINNCITVIDQAMYLHEHAASGFFGDTPHNMYTQVRPPPPTAQPGLRCCGRQLAPPTPTPTRAAPRACLAGLAGRDHAGQGAAARAAPALVYRPQHTARA